MPHSPAVDDLRQLGTGPIATVYIGRSADTGDDVAIKVYPDKLGRDTAARLARERADLAALRTVRSILAVDGEVAVPGGRHATRMELCRGSLARRVASGGPVPVAEALAVGSAVASALAAAHPAGVVHGGLTPHNVLFRMSGEICVSDFGLALREDLRADRAYAVEYTAPETLRDAVRTTASDLYGLGAVLYLALTGAAPFPRRTGVPPAERILQVLREPAPAVEVPGVPAALSDVVARLLAKEPADRPVDAAGLVDLFEGLRRGMTAPEPEPTPQDDYDFDDFAPTRVKTPGARPVPVAIAAPGPVSPVADPVDPAPRTATPPATGTPPGDGSARRTLVKTFGGPGGTRGPRARRPAILVGIAAAVVTLTVIPLTLLPRDKPAGHDQAAPAVRVAPEVTVGARMRLELAPPTDEGTQVQLSWQTDADLDFAVVVAGEQLQNMVLVAHRTHTMRVPVDPDRKYCFLIRGTDGQRIYTSDPVPIRGARCNL
ncbi:serine/threonine protein kinase [Longispora fulva]|uniref:non-specific serine/threonine protein kinase n=1 Tax=Longispora fulva TaxID=619741 RepID=A0A8J7KP42_9ACTN|nr:protein kinase [Longispora fulva]MBG6135882.1 hypothetical protein [Longispora fulva]